MNESSDQSAKALRDAFDAAFAQPHPSPESFSIYLGIRVGPKRRFAIDGTQAAAVVRAPQVTATPSNHTALLGIAALRGRLVALFDLSWWLHGQESMAPGGWAVTCRQDPSVGFVFADFEGSISVPRRLVAQSEPGASPFTPAMMASDPPRDIIALETILNDIRNETHGQKET